MITPSSRSCAPATHRAAQRAKLRPGARRCPGNGDRQSRKDRVMKTQPLRGFGGPPGAGAGGRDEADRTAGPFDYPRPASAKSGHRDEEPDTAGDAESLYPRACRYGADLVMYRRPGASPSRTRRSSISSASRPIGRVSRSITRSPERAARTAVCRRPRHTETAPHRAASRNDVEVAAALVLWVHTPGGRIRRTSAGVLGLAPRGRRTGR